MRGSRSLFLSLAVLFTTVGSARSQQGYVYVRIDDMATACSVDIPAGLHVARVYVVNSHPFQGVEFRTPVPAGIQYFGEQSNFLAIGNSQTGVQIGTGCQNTFQLEVLTITFFAAAPLNDVTWTVEPVGGQATIRLADCTGFWMKGSNEYSIFCDEGTMPGPYKPYPPDGATNVPLDVQLSFVGAATEVGVADHAIQWPYEGNVFYCLTSVYPDPYPDCVFPTQIGGLLPNTTYYWRAINTCCCCPHGDTGYGDVWSFTTADGTVPTSTTTWGAIKAMYRD